MRSMAHDPVHDEDVAEVTHLTAEAASALISGDVRRYLTFIGHADDYTLLQPFGGSQDAVSTPRMRRWKPRRASSTVAMRTSKSSSPTRPAISSSLWSSNGSTVKSATSRTRTGPCE